METNQAKQAHHQTHLTSVSDSTITVHYSYESDDALFDVCDLSGSILMSGKLADTDKIDVSELPSGVYVFYIIDSGKVHKERIQV